MSRGVPILGLLAVCMFLIGGPVIAMFTLVLFLIALWRSDA